jgi:hypothetical protein
MFTSPEGDQYIVTEYLPKGSLRDIIQSQQAQLTTKDLLYMQVPCYVALTKMLGQLEQQKDFHA